MNINEISKPSVERAVVNALLNRQGVDPVTKSKKIADSIHFSSESKKRFKKRLKKRADVEQEEPESGQISSEYSPESGEGSAVSATNFEAENPSVPKAVNRSNEPKGLTIDIKV